jgi:hypothetical protein
VSDTTASEQILSPARADASQELELQLREEASDPASGTVATSENGQEESLAREWRMSPFLAVRFLTEPDQLLKFFEERVGWIRASCDPPTGITPFVGEAYLAELELLASNPPWNILCSRLDLRTVAWLRQIEEPYIHKFLKAVRHQCDGLRLFGFPTAPRISPPYESSLYEWNDLDSHFSEVLAFLGSHARAANGKSESDSPQSGDNRFLVAATTGEGGFVGGVGEKSAQMAEAEKNSTPPDERVNQFVDIIDFNGDHKGPAVKVLLRNGVWSDWKEVNEREYAALFSIACVPKGLTRADLDGVFETGYRDLNSVCKKHPEINALIQRPGNRRPRKGEVIANKYRFQNPFGAS